MKEEDPNGRLLLPKQELRILRDYREDIHALVGYGVHGTNEEIQDFKCQACRKKFTARKNTILYRLKSHSGLIEKILWLLALGVDALALEEVFGVRGITIRTWLCRSGMQGKKLHEHSVAELELVHVQLDELWANVKDGSHDMWVWIVSDVKTKLTRSCRWGDEVRRWRLPWFMNLRGDWQQAAFPCSAQMAFAITFMP